MATQAVTGCVLKMTKRKSNKDTEDLLRQAREEVQIPSDSSSSPNGEGIQELIDPGRPGEREDPTSVDLLKGYNSDSGPLMAHEMSQIIQKVAPGHSEQFYRLYSEILHSEIKSSQELDEVIGSEEEKNNVIKELTSDAYISIQEHMGGKATITDEVANNPQMQNIIRNSIKAGLQNYLFDRRETNRNLETRSLNIGKRIWEKMDKKIRKYAIGTAGVIFATAIGSYLVGRGCNAPTPSSNLETQVRKEGDKISKKVEDTIDKNKKEIKEELEKYTKTVDKGIKDASSTIGTVGRAITGTLSNLEKAVNSLNNGINDLKKYHEIPTPEPTKTEDKKPEYIPKDKPEDKPKVETPKQEDEKPEYIPKATPEPTKTPTKEDVDKNYKDIMEIIKGESRWSYEGSIGPAFRLPLADKGDSGNKAGIGYGVQGRGDAKYKISEDDSLTIIGTLGYYNSESSNSAPGVIATDEEDTIRATLRGGIEHRFGNSGWRAGINLGFGYQHTEADIRANGKSVYSDSVDTLLGVTGFALSYDLAQRFNLGVYADIGYNFNEHVTEDAIVGIKGGLTFGN